MKYKIRTKERPDPNDCYEVEDERILANNVIFGGEFNPHRVRAWIIGNQYGPMGVVWADCAQDALDELVDADLAGGILIDEKDLSPEEIERCEYARLGNAGELADLDYCWINEVLLEPEHDIELMLAFARADGAGARSLFG